MLNSNTAAFLFVFGYQCYAPILALVGVESSVYSAVGRGLILIYGICVIFTNRNLKISIEEAVLILFVAAVSFKLYMESFILGDIDPKFFQVHLLTVLLPCMVVSVLPAPAGSILDGKLLIFGWVALLINILVAVLAILADPLSLLSGRLEHANLNANSLGLYATCIGLAALHQKRRLISITATPWLLAANSRQSLLAFFVGFLSLLGMRVFRSLRIMITALGLIAFMATFYLFFMMGTAFDVFSRLLSVTSHTETSVTTRLDGITQAFEQFAASPILGSTLNNGAGGFPHNILLETLTGFGVLAALLLAALIVLAVYRLRANKVNRSLLLVYLVSSMLSGGLYAYNELFILMMLSFKKKTERGRVGRQYELVNNK